jgi:hypothetical protein
MTETRHSVRNKDKWTVTFIGWVPDANDDTIDEWFEKYPNIDEALKAYYSVPENYLPNTSHAPSSSESTSPELQPISNGTDAPQPPSLEALASSPSGDAAHPHHAAAEIQPPVPAEQPDLLGGASAPVPSDVEAVPLHPSRFIIHRSAFPNKKRKCPDSDVDDSDGGDVGGDDEGGMGNAPLPNDEDYYDDDDDMGIADVQVVEDGVSNDDDDEEEEEEEVDGVDEDDAGVLEEVKVSNIIIHYSCMSSLSPPSNVIYSFFLFYFVYRNRVTPIRMLMSLPP